MTQKLQQLQEAIREVCTELKALSPGCLVKLESGFIRQVWQVEYNEDDEVERIFTESSSIGMYQYTSKNGFEIIGHPIQLQHILRALSFKCCAIKINQIGGISLYSESGSCWQDLAYPRFNLEKPLDQQSPEVIDFLHSIICKG